MNYLVELRRPGQRTMSLLPFDQAEVAHRAAGRRARWGLYDHIAVVTANGRRLVARYSTFPGVNA